MARASAELVGLERSLNAERVQGLLLHREAIAVGRGMVERRLLDRASRAVYDFDDALHEDHGSGVRALFPKSATVRACVDAADCVIAANDHLAEWANEFADEVVVVPSCIEPSKYGVRADTTGRWPSLVWLGSPSTSMFLFEVADALREICTRHRAIVRAVGADDRVRSIGDFVEVVPWRLGIDAELCDLGDIGIMPMPDTAYARGKSAYKLLQYAAAGLPSVASSVGASAQIARSIGATCVSAQDEWVDALDHLLRNEGTRRSVGAEARRRVVSDYSYDRWLAPMRSALGLD